MAPSQLGMNVRIVNDFMHDLVPGFIAGLAAATFAAERAIDKVEPGRGVVVSRASGILWLLYAVALAVAVTTGLIRLRYWKLNVRSGFLETKTQMAVIKHSAFTLLVVVSGAVLAFVG